MYTQDSFPIDAFLVAFLQFLPEVARRAGMGRQCWVVGTHPLAASGHVSRVQRLHSS